MLAIADRVWKTGSAYRWKRSKRYEFVDPVKSIFNSPEVLRDQATALLYPSLRGHRIRRGSEGVVPLQ